MAKVLFTAFGVGVTAGGIAAGVSLAATAYGAVQSRNANKDSRRAQAVQKRIQDVKAARERRKLLNQARVNQASILAQGQAAGGGQSSGVQSGASQQSTQAASGISFLNQVQDLTNQASIFNQSAANSKSRANTAGAIGEIASGYTSLYGTGDGTDDGTG